MLYALLTTAGAAPAAEPGDSPTLLPLYEVSLSGHHYQVEVASTAAQRARGLMHRDRLANDRGMLFLFPTARPLAFWMKNTRIPLDILMFDAHGRLLQIHHAVPPCRHAPCRLYRSPGTASMALELSAGTARAADLRPGTLLRTPKDLPPATD